jgi:ParB family transcriptional regulator, chromosome partitioning protein
VTDRLISKLPDKHAGVLPTGRLLTLSTEELRPNPNNPRRLFDDQPLRDLKENIRTHGVLVPITVYQIPGQERYAILDGERRFRCCRELQAEGMDIRIPANVVEPPDTLAGMLYMFNIHNYRQPWELMPTALSLEFLITQLDEADDRKLASLTGLDDKQVQRCKTLLSFPRRFQEMSLEEDPQTRIPSNFWIELYPVLQLCEKQIPDLVAAVTRDGITDRFVEKYRAKTIRSVIHLRRILEAYDVAETARQRVLLRLREFVLDTALETRASFDEFISESRRAQTALSACRAFLEQMDKARLENLTDEREQLAIALRQVADLTNQLLGRLADVEPPPGDVELVTDEDDEDGE